MRITKQGAQCATKPRRPQPWCRLLEHARYEVLPTASAEEQVLAHVAPTTTLTVTASPSKGLEPTLELTERLTAARLHRGPAPGRADGAGPGRAGGDLRAADLAGHRPGLRARRRRRPARRLPRRALAARGDQGRSGAPFSHVGITGYPESHPTISDDLTIQAMWDKRRYATHVVSNLTFDPEHGRDLGAADAQARHHDAAAARHPRARSTGPSCCRWPPRSGSGSRPGSWPRTRAPSPGSPRPAASPASGSSRRSHRHCRPPEMLVEGLHVFTFNQVAGHRGVAAEPARPADD